jgi:branched-chain amino acid transport system ATP-binding protein
MLEVRGLSLRIGGLAVLDNVDIDVDSGELVALIGPNGAGKTSLLNCVSGTYRQTAGRIRISGRDIAGAPAHAVATAGIGRTFQHVELFSQLSVADNVLAGRHLHFRTTLLLDALYWGPTMREERNQRAAIEPVLQLVGLEAMADRPASDLPYGLQKLVGLARALALQPRLLLLDEPSAGMHREERSAFARVLRRIQQQLHIAILWVEHDMELVADLATRVAVLDHGTLIASGSPQAVLRDPEVARVYLGSGSQR